MNTYCETGKTGKTNQEYTSTAGIIVCRIDANAHVNIETGTVILATAVFLYANS